jgi:hypothetical protein
VTQRKRISTRGRHVRRRSRIPLVLAVAVALAAIGFATAKGLPSQARGSGTAHVVVPVVNRPAIASAEPSPAAISPKPAWQPRNSAELPPGPPIPAAGSGQFHVIPGASVRSGTGSLHTYTVEVEDGIAVPGGDDRFGAIVQATLADPHSWIGGGRIAVRRIDTGTPRFHVRFTSQRTARARCGFDIPVDVSCRVGPDVYLSAARWIRGAVAYHGDLDSYRQYMVNHEVGHAFGNGHRPCPVNGGPAPVMMQQTFSVSDNEILDISGGSAEGVVIHRDGKVCTPNPWPYP